MTTRWPLLLCCALGSFAGCDLIDLPFATDPDEPDGPNPATQLQTNVPTFDLDGFVANLQAELDDDYAGVQAVVIDNGQLYASWASGNAIYSPNAQGDIAMTVDNRQNVASVSKFIGTIALMQVLQDQGIGVEQPIHQLLAGPSEDDHPPRPLRSRL